MESSASQAAAFQIIINEVQSACEKLQKANSFVLCTAPRDLPKKGIYVISDGDECLYVGRSNNIPRRLKYHTACNHNQATFAFLLARKLTGQIKATYKKEGSRAALLKQLDFKKAFDDARGKIRNMSVRVIEENDATRQALLEICAAITFRAKHNDFENH